MKSERGNSRSGALTPAQGSLRPAHMPPPPVLPQSVPHHHWPRAPVPPRHSGAVGLFSPPRTAGLLQPQGGRQRSVWRRLKGRTVESGRRSGGCTVPVPEGSTWLSPSSVTGDSWGDSSWRWGPVPPKGVEDRTGLGWLCLDGSANVTPFCLPLELQLSRRSPKASFWMAQEPPPSPQPSPLPG